MKINNIVLKKAHALCKEMKEQGFVFDYHAQLGLNMKYFWEILRNEETDADEIMEEEMFEDVEYEEEDEELIPIEYVSHIALKEDKGYSFLFRTVVDNRIVEFTALANKNHKYPVVYDANPIDFDLLERVKDIVNEKTNIYNTLEHDYVPEYRYHRHEDGLFIYFDEAAETFRGYYCGNDVYGGRAFTFDIKNQEGPCSRSLRQLVKDHKANNFGAYTTMKGRGTTITKWRERIIRECRQLWKESKNASKITEAKVVIDNPWNYDEVLLNAAIRFLAQMGVRHEFKYESYQAAVDSKLFDIANKYKEGDKFNKKFDKLIAKYQDRIHALKLTNLYREVSDSKPSSTVQAPTDLDNVEI